MSDERAVRETAREAVARALWEDNQRRTTEGDRRHHPESAAREKPWGDTDTYDRAEFLEKADLALAAAREYEHTPSDETLRAILREREQECGAGWQRAVEYQRALEQARTFLKSVASAQPQGDQGGWMIDTAREGLEKSEVTFAEPDATPWVAVPAAPDTGPSKDEIEAAARAGVEWACDEREQRPGPELPRWAELDEQTRETCLAQSHACLYAARAVRTARAEALGDPDA